jgi:hypothetical protein
MGYLAIGAPEYRADPSPPRMDALPGRPRDLLARDPHFIKLAYSSRNHLQAFGDPAYGAFTFT